MKLAFDTETALMRPGLAAPPLACASWCDEDHNSGLYHARDSLEPLRRWITSGWHLYGLNMPYDMAVAAAEFPELLEPIIEAYLDCRVHDVGLDQRLTDIANGELDGRWEDNPDFDPSQPMKGKNKPRRWRKNKYALAELAKRLWGEYINKGADTWRLHYGALRELGVPVDCTRPGCDHAAMLACEHPSDLPRYGELLCSYPMRARKYAIEDAVKTMDVHLFQLEHSQIAGGYTIDDVLVDSGAQAQANFALHLQSCRGIRTDGARCRALVGAAEIEIDRCRALCVDAGLVKGTKTGKWQKKQAPAREYMIGALLRSSGIIDCPEHRQWLVEQVAHFVNTVDELPKDRHAHFSWPDEDELTEVSVKLTKSGEISLDAEQCKDANDPILRAYATFTSATSLRSKAKRMLLGATIPLQTRYQTLVATGRTSSSKSDQPLIGDNFQNFRRNAMVSELGLELPGQRECIKARDGYVLCSIDGDNAEMRSEAQIAIWSEGYSNLADSLNRGEDAHLALAAGQLLKQTLSYNEAQKLYKAKDPEVDNARQFAKVPNFALLGGARALTMIPYAKGMNITLTEPRAHELYGAFHNQWTEIAPMHAKIRQALRQGGGSFVMQQWVSNRLRLIDRYTVGCNGPFQSLTADAFKSSLLWLAAECYTGKEYAIGPDGWRVQQTGKLSPLAGSYPILFCHDEDILELLESAHTHEAAFRARDIIVQGYNRFTPDVPMTAEPTLMRYWYKSAKSVYDEKGRLVVWEPKQKVAA